MCVIIEKFADKEIPYANLQSACDINSHGWGATIFDRGKLETVREYNKKGNDPDKIAKFLEQAKGTKAVAHMRIQTSGNRDKFNCHPFDVLDQNKDGVEIKFFHNGTMHQFVDSNSDFSDSYWFTSKILKPLFSRWAQTDEPDAVLKSPVLRSVMSQYATSMSVFTLIDSFGNIIHINKDKGEEYDWGWASNRHSFRWAKRHEEKVTPTKDTSTKHFMQQGSKLVPFVPTQQHPSTSLYDFDNDNKTTREADKAATVVAQKIQENKEKYPIVRDKADGTQVVTDRPYLASPKDRQTFKELTNLQSLREICWLEDQELVEFCCLYPDLMALLVMDLAWELYQLKPNPNFS